MVGRSTVGRVDVVLFSGWLIAIVYPPLFPHQVPKLSNDLTLKHLRHSALQFGLTALTRIMNWGHSLSARLDDLFVSPIFMAVAGWRYHYHLLTAAKCPASP